VGVEHEYGIMNCCLAFVSKIPGLRSCTVCSDFKSCTEL
jgi:hypothetical protein